MFSKFFQVCSRCHKLNVLYHAENEQEWTQSRTLWTDLDGTTFGYNCCMQRAHVTSATLIVSSKTDVQNLTKVVHNTKNVVGF